MSTTIDYTDPAKRCLASEVKLLDSEALVQHLKDIEHYVKTGTASKWMVVKKDDVLVHIEFWNSFDLARYKLLINMELLDRCNSFELLPKLKFHF